MRYTIGGEYSPESLGRCMFDKCLLIFSEGIPKVLNWVKDYAYDADVFHLVPLKTITAYFAFNSSDFGKSFVKIYIRYFW